ncbi:urease accessory protein UreD [Oceanisphaera sp. W20_SRM_FM3]|uniref:urease accessory protein UreD n=1 Tax=Oceanisphaera sp. W20_SRM_FM3 TaxID=3240267 RepID=UPI003F9CAB31
MSVTPSLTPLGYGADRLWLAELDIKLVPIADKTHLKQLAFTGPLRIQRPFYPEGGVCHLYVLHPPGGLVSGDQLKIQAFCAANSQSLLTTPSAGKIYGRDSDGVAQGQRVRLQLANNAECEWLPQETLIFRDANALLDTQIELDTEARFIGWDLVCLGRPAAGEVFNKGRLDQRIRLWRNGRLLFNERLQLTADSELQHSRVGLADQCVFGTLVASGPELDAAPQTELLNALRSCLPSPVFTVTQRLGVLLVRYLGNDMNQCRAGMWQAWSLTRPVLLGRPACIPRIWHT